MPSVQLKDFKMHYVESGSGAEPLVFVHGFISTHRWWQPALARLPKNFYSCYAVDLRACGESEHIEAGHYRHDTHRCQDAKQAGYLGD